MKTLKLFTICLALLLTACASLDSRARETPTAELKLRHAQILQAIGYDNDVVDLSALRPPIWGGSGGPDLDDLLEEKEAIERELLKRWQGGEEIAYLPIFESLK